MARELVPEVSFAGDFICGFSGETDEDPCGNFRADKEGAL